ncbi:unnamed protein product, partial [Symbiodinium microadriaticum]
ESVELQATVNEIKSAKAALLDEIMAETQNMEREIHRMGLRLEALKREQEFSGAKTKDPPKAGRTLTSTTKKESPAELTRATMKKRISALKKDARALSNETSQYTGAIEERKAQFSEMTSELERVTTQYSDMEEGNRELQNIINDLLYQKQLNQERVSYRQKYVKRLKDYSATGIDISLTLQTQRRLLAASQALDNVKEIITDLQRANPHLTDVLDRVMAMTDPGIDVGEGV